MGRLSVGQRLYASVMAVFLVFALSFIIFQHNREKQYKIELLNVRLQDFNAHLAEIIRQESHQGEGFLNRYVRQSGIKDIRVTIINRRGDVTFDNITKDYRQMGNHANRPEIVRAIENGMGTAVDRSSRSLGREYFYSATYFPDRQLIIRSALPYNSDLANSLKADLHFVWFAFFAMAVLTLVLYHFVSRLGTNITKLKIFAERADHNESLDVIDLAGFPADELGEIAEKIIKIYKRLQSTRQEQDMLKRQLTQNVAHELKTPVASIQGYLETILNSKNMDETTRQQFLQRCFAQSGRLASLLTDISTLNRMDDAPEMHHFEKVDIAEIVSSVEKETMLQMEDKRMTFVNHLPAQLVIDGNRSLLYGIFRNLTDNAIAYAGEGTTITLTAERQGEAWLFRFADNGVGVPVEHLGRIFERFYRVDKGRSRKMGGTGLGLAIVKNAVLLHGGSIKANARPEGGLLFTFTLATGLVPPVTPKA